jgi:D-alanyl-D-alanine carboxypeptidase
MKLKIAFTLFLTGHLGLAKATPDLLVDHHSLLQKYAIAPQADQSYCTLHDKKVTGYQVHKIQRIASLTKLITTLFVSETLDLHQTFETKVYIGKDALHIEGSRDPYFEEEKMLLMMRHLKMLGYRSFSRVTFNSNFKFSDQALSSHAELPASHTRERLAYFFTPSNLKGITAKWNMIRKFADEEGVNIPAESVPLLRAGVVALSEANPLIHENPVVYVHRSRPLYALLKAMNVMSKNIVAHQFYQEASRVKSFSQVAAQVGLNPGAFVLYNGSGLPVINGNDRKDNLGSCIAVLQAIQALEKSLNKHQLTFSDVVAVNGGVDLGSFRDRFDQQPETHGAVISKTGTLKHTSSLAGLLYLKESVPFAILNHTTNIIQARKFQDAFVARIFQHLGSPTIIPYQKIHIFPVDQADFFF